MTVPTTTVSDLLAQARGGDPRALDHLFAACRSYLQVLARARLHGRLAARADPSDLVQQTLVDAYRGFGGFAGGTSAEWLAWLRRILERNAADLARHHAAGKRAAAREVTWAQPPPGASSLVGPPDPPAAGDSPSACLVRQEQALRVAEALGRLSPDHRDVILLRNLEGLPFDEVARRLNRSRPAAQMLWLRALQRLHAELGEE
jgi:RNA polymerase sigma-70 factor, ECF subfamily